MIRRTLRDLPAIKWRDEKLNEWRELARQQKAELREARAEIERLRGASAGVTGVEPGDDLDGATLTRDKPGTLPRAELSRRQVKALNDAGYPGTVGAAPGDARAYPSFVTQLYEARRRRDHLRNQGLRNHPRSAIPKKLQNLALGASHGVQPPNVLRIWTRKNEIDLSELPEEFVIKSNGGAGSRGVYPLRRVDAARDLYEVNDTTRRRITGAEVVRNLTTDRKLLGPWFAEEMLVADMGDDPLPADIKIYAFYGEVGYGFARRAPMHRGAQGWQENLQFRYFDAQCRDIPLRRDPASQTDIPFSPKLPQMVEFAKVLSRAVPLPFVRVDLYGTPQGVVMGEITLVPGGSQHVFPLEDARLGLMWEEAEMRLQIDLANNGRPFRNIAGDHPVPEILRPYLPQTD